MARTKEQNAIMNALREAGGSAFQESDIRREGTQIVLPERGTVGQHIATLEEFERAQEQHTTVYRDYMYRPLDGAAATERALVALTGTTGVQMPIQTFFGQQSPQRVTVPIGVGRTITVPWGKIHVPLFQDRKDDDPTYIQLGAYNHDEYGHLFRLSAEVPKKYVGHANGLFDLVQEELEQRSIYRGQAITGAAEPEFLDLSGIEPDKIIYSDDVIAQLDAHLFGVIRYADEMREHGVSLKRSVLFYGPYGTGKTLGGMRTAQVAVENGWTFIQCRPGKDDPFDVLQTAQLYAPAVVFIEDIDTYSRSSGMGLDQMSLLLDKFDGIEAKNHEILAVMTTNHEESITKGMLRPGRLDALIEISALDRNGVKRMVESLVPSDMLDGVDYDLMYEACIGYLPAFVSEAVTRAKNASIVRGEGTLLPLTTADLINGAHSMRAQFHLMEKASEVELPPTLDTVMDTVIRKAVSGVEVYDFNEEGVNAELRSS